MQAENESRRDWWREPVAGWRDGRLEWRSIMTGETTVIRFRRRSRADDVFTSDPQMLHLSVAS